MLVQAHNVINMKITMDTKKSFFVWDMTASVICIWKQTRTNLNQTKPIQTKQTKKIYAQNVTLAAGRYNEFLERSQATNTE